MRAVPVLILSLLICFSGVSSGQKSGKKIVVTGKITDKNGKPVAGASIFIDNVKTGQVTDALGLYKVKVKPEVRKIMAFTLLNGTREELIDGRTEINMVLSGSSADNIEKTSRDGEKEMSQPGGEKDSKRPGTVDVGKTKIAVYQDIYDMIRGRVPGVNVSGKHITVRGTSSLNVATEPLFVVDGVIVNAIDDIAPETVKSIEVLKGPDATAYGIRGSNGVILITRKKGIE